jgi:lysophospholipase L1-like esterase
MVQTAGVRWRNFVAVGDSFTEGLDDPYPDGGKYRGWADLVAGHLAALTAASGAITNPAPDGATVDPALPAPDGAITGPAPDGNGFGYANLAIRGRLFHAVVTEQVPPVLAMGADLVSFAAGGNDVLRRHFDPPAMVAKFDSVVGELRASGADVILFRFADVTKRLPGRRLVRPRVDLLNDATAETAQRHGALLVDLWSDDEFGNPLLWSLDRLHLSPAGHRRVAAHVLSALGANPQPDWLAVPPLPGPRPWLAARGADLRWAGEYLAPWIRRRLTGRSSGDLVTAKRPSLAPFTE